MENQKEIWETIKSFENYQVSNLGNVKSLDRLIKRDYHGDVKYNGKVLKNNLNHKGYPVVYLSVNSKQKTISVHRLVAIAFIKNPENKPQVNHKNGIKTDNRVDNLEWCTNKENQIHAYKNGLRNSQRGVLNGFSKLTEKEVLEIRSLKNKEIKLKYLSKKYNVSMTTISDIKKYKIWKHI